MLEQALVAFVTFLVVIDPPGVAPLFAALTKDAPAPWRRTMAIKSILIATAILIGFAFLGGPLLGAMGVSLDAFRLAGGILLFLIALDMVFERRQNRRDERTHKVQEEHAGQSEQDPDDISVFPLALPLIAGPGAITTVLLYMTNPDFGFAERAASLGALVLVLALCLLAFLGASLVMRLIGPSASNAITRVLGVILAALAAQLVLDGLRNTFFVA